MLTAEDKLLLAIMIPGSPELLTELVSWIDEKLAAEREVCAKEAESLAHKAHTYASENADAYRAYDNGILAAAAKIRKKAVSA